MILTYFVSVSALQKQENNEHSATSCVYQRDCYLTDKVWGV